MDLPDLSKFDQDLAAFDRVYALVKLATDWLESTTEKHRTLMRALLEDKQAEMLIDSLADGMFKRCALILWRTTKQ